MKVILLVVVVLVGLYMIGATGPRAELIGTAEPAGSIEIVSLSCVAKGSRTEIEATFRNTGSVAIKFPRLFIAAAGQTKDYFTYPTTLPPGSMGSADGQGADSGMALNSNVPCEVVAAQDISGNPIL